MAVFIGIGLMFVAASSWIWWQQPMPKGAVAPGDEWRPRVLGVIFGLWTLALPIYFLFEWLHYPPPENMLIYQYGHKVASDAWTAITLVLGVLFGVKKF